MAVGCPCSSCPRAFDSLLPHQLGVKIQNSYFPTQFIKNYKFAEPLLFALQKLLKTGLGTGLDGKNRLSWMENCALQLVIEKKPMRPLTRNPTCLIEIPEEPRTASGGAYRVCRIQFEYSGGIPDVRGPFSSLPGGVDFSHAPTLFAWDAA